MLTSHVSAVPRNSSRRAMPIALLIGAALVWSLQDSFAAPPSQPEPRAKQVQPAQPSVPNIAPTASTPPTPSSPTINKIEGFRSAKFGMTEEEVRNAAKTDFPSEATIDTSTNPVEQTKILSLKIPAPLPSGGAAKVSYVFGYKTKKLIQISVVWSKATDEKNDPAELVAAGEILKTNFVEQNYRPDSIGINQNTSAGVLLFKGEDAQDHVTILLLQGTAPADKQNEAFAPSSLLLLYIADAKRPDIFKLTQGQF